MMVAEESPPSFARDMQSLFRESDRGSMEFAFDLWDYQDVRTHAEDILERLTEGSIPCDGEWPEERVVQFRLWVEAGCLLSCTGYLDHPFAHRFSLRASSVYVYFKQPTADKELTEIWVSGVKLLSRSFRHVIAGFIPSKA